jgi:hypothetical protein
MRVHHLQPAPMKGAPRSPQFLAAQHLRAAQAQGASLGERSRFELGLLTLIQGYRRSNSAR